MQVRGVATAGRATKCWMWLVKLMRLQPTYKQIQTLIQHPDSPVRFGSMNSQNREMCEDVIFALCACEQFLRGIGFLFLRYCCDPKQLWGWFQPYLQDPEEMQIRKFDKRKATVGQFLCEILINVEYESTHVRVGELAFIESVIPCANPPHIPTSQTEKKIKINTQPRVNGTSTPECHRIIERLHNNNPHIRAHSFPAFQSRSTSECLQKSRLVNDQNNFASQQPVIGTTGYCHCDDRSIRNQILVFVSAFS